MNVPHSDALVFFGATGDLAYKISVVACDDQTGAPQHAGYRGSQGRLECRSAPARARDSVEKHGGGLDPAAFDKLCGLRRYVDGDYKDAATFQAIRKELNSAQRPAHYLAIPPALFGLVVEQLTKARCANGARVIVEKPFGHDLVSAQQLNQILRGTFDEEHVFRIDHYLGKREYETWSYASRTQF